MTALTSHKDSARGTHACAHVNASHTHGVHTHPPSCTHKHTCVRTVSQTHVHTGTHTRTLADMCAQTHRTHAHTPPSVMFSVFLGPRLWHTDVPRPGVRSELQLPVYTTATAIRDLSCLCDLHHSSQQRQILNPLSEARDRTPILMDTSYVLNPLSHSGNSRICALIEEPADLTPGKEAATAGGSFVLCRRCPGQVSPGALCTPLPPTPPSAPALGEEGGLGGSADAANITSLGACTALSPDPGPPPASGGGGGAG